MITWRRRIADSFSPPSIHGIEDANDENKEDDYTLYQLDNRGKHGA